MANMTTVLSRVSTSGTSLTYLAPASTVLKPSLVLQRSKMPNGNNPMAEATVSVVQATVDAEGLPVRQKILMSATVKYPNTGASADIDAALVLFREAVASDNFTAVVNAHKPLQ